MPIGDSTIQELRQRYNDGEGPAHIAAQLGIGVATVIRYTRSLPRQRARVTPDMAAEIHNMIRRGDSRKSIAENLGISLSAVDNHDPRPSPAHLAHPLTPEAKAQMFTMLAQGVKPQTIAAEIGYSVATVRREGTEPGSRPPRPARRAHSARRAELLHRWAQGPPAMQRRPPTRDPQGRQPAPADAARVTSRRTRCPLTITSRQGAAPSPTLRNTCGLLLRDTTSSGAGLRFPSS